LCILIGFGAAQTEDQQPAVALASPPLLTFDVSRNHVVLSGDVSSVAHESILRQHVLTLFPQKTTSFNLNQRPALPPGWALISEMALRAVAQTYSSRTEITASGIQIRGITKNASTWQNELSRIEDRLLPGMGLEHEVSEISVTGSLDRQCVALFRSALRGRKIEFPPAGASLGTVAMPLLDELIQISADCPAASIAITGHTDKTGDESVNLALSKARAEAVAAYMAAGGIAMDRLTVEGAGSARPLVAQDSPRAYQQNRRIEIAMIVPPS
jgi:OOP family OmpA-OmpF porin